jgi:tektin-3
MAELMGQTQTATYTYMTAPRFNGLATPNFLPTIGNASAPFKPYDTYPAPTPLRRSLTTLPWRPGTYYGTARIEPGIAHAYSMPEPLSERTKLAELDSFKVS